jgi:hypothetical protein
MWAFLRETGVSDWQLFDLDIKGLPLVQREAYRLALLT